MRFTLSAYLVADINDALERVDPVFHLTNGLDDESRNKPINSKRYGERTWFDHARHRFSMFNLAEVRAIIAYLRFCRARKALLVAIGLTGYSRRSHHSAV